MKTGTLSFSAMDNTPAFISTPGTSIEALYVTRQVNGGRQRLQEPYSLGLRSKGVFDQLDEVAEECGSPNWDGYHAAPVTLDAFRQAYLFLEALPLGTPPPSVGAEPDGHVTVEWHDSRGRTLSVSVSADGQLHYAAVIGSNKAYGTEVFFGEVPATILHLIGRVA
jgi:hypothetical protein